MCFTRLRTRASAPPPTRSGHAGASLGRRGRRASWCERIMIRAHRTSCDTGYFVAKLWPTCWLLAWSPHQQRCASHYYVVKW